MHPGQPRETPLDNPFRPGVRRGVGNRAAVAFRAWVAGADDRRLERTVGSRPGLRALFSGLERAYVPGRAEGLHTEVAFVLRTAAGAPRPWVLRITPVRARAQRGVAPAAALRVVLSVADLARIAAGELDPGTALLTGRLDLEGDFDLATRLGELFGVGPL